MTVCCQILLHCDFWWSRWWYQNSKNIWERDGLDCHRCNNVGYMIDWIWIKKDIWSKVMFISVPLSIYINFDWPSCLPLYILSLTSQTYCQKNTGTILNLMIFVNLWSWSDNFCSNNTWKSIFRVHIDTSYTHSDQTIQKGIKPESSSIEKYRQIANDNIKKDNKHAYHCICKRMFKYLVMFV